MKKLLCFISACAITLGATLMMNLAHAATNVGTGKIYVGGEDIVADSDHIVESSEGEGFVQFYQPTVDSPARLVFEGYNYVGNGHSGYGIYLNNVKQPVKIELINSSSISINNQPSTDSIAGLCSEYTDVIVESQSAGTLSLSVGQAKIASYGIYTRYSNFTLNSGTIDAQAGTSNASYGLYLLSSSSDAHTLTVNGGQLHAYGGESNNAGVSDYRYASFGMFLNTAKFYVNDGEVIAEGNKTLNSSCPSVGISVSGYGTGFYGGSVYARGYKDNTVDSYGIKVKESTYIVELGKDAKHIEIAGKTGTYFGEGEVVALFQGVGYTDYDGTEGATTINKNTSFNNYKKAVFQNITATVTEYEGDYDGNPHKISITGLDPSDAVVQYSTDGETYSTTNPEFTIPGDYTVYYQISKENYPTKTGTAHVKINKIKLVFENFPTCKSDLTFDGNSYCLLDNSGTCDASIGEIKYMISDNPNVWDTEENITRTNAGTYEVHCKVFPFNSNIYDESDEEVLTVTINAADLVNVVVEVETETLKYDGTAKAPTINATGKTVLNRDVDFTYSKEEAGTYSSTIPTFVEIGTHTIYWKAYAESHNEQKGSITFSIVKGDSVYTSEPTIKQGLKYTNSNLALVNAGKTTCGTIIYKLGSTGEYGETIPTGKLVGEYTIFYKIIGNGNYNDSEEQSLTISIAANSKSELENIIANAEEYYNTIKSYSFATDLNNAITVAKAVNNDPNKTVEEISDAINALDAALGDAKVKVCKDLINSIGEVENTNDSKEKIDAAKSAYDALDERLKAKIDNYETLKTAELRYQELNKKSDGLAPWAIVLIIIASILCLLCLTYVLLFLVFNKWINVDGKPVRVIKLGKKDDKRKVMAMPCKVILKNEEEIFNSKSEAIK